MGKKSKKGSSRANTKKRPAAGKGKQQTGRPKSETASVASRASSTDGTPKAPVPVGPPPKDVMAYVNTMLDQQVDKENDAAECVEQSVMSTTKSAATAAAAGAATTTETIENAIAETEKIDEAATPTKAVAPVQLNEEEKIVEAVASVIDEGKKDECLKVGTAVTQLEEKIAAVAAEASPLKASKEEKVKAGPTAVPTKTKEMIATAVTLPEKVTEKVEKVEETTAAAAVVQPATKSEPVPTPKPPVAAEKKKITTTPVPEKEAVIEKKDTEPTATTTESKKIPDAAVPRAKPDPNAILPVPSDELKEVMKSALIPTSPSGKEIGTCSNMDEPAEKEVEVNSNECGCVVC